MYDRNPELSVTDIYKIHGTVRVVMLFKTLHYSGKKRLKATDKLDDRQ